jgi:hypothetical protein
MILKLVFHLQFFHEEKEEEVGRGKYANEVKNDDDSEVERRLPPEG